ncbi:uncharacterized protein [Ambystoma mexicanum]|uniref:uncharacterized protein n=1 Tax=Ambystoma mexicanum TaxID=8296 RepID=UPI0037E72534
MRLIKDLYMDKSITIRPADKGGALVIQNTIDYDMECTRQLQDRTIYATLDHDPTITIKQNLKSLLDKAFELEWINEHTQKFLSNSHPRIPNFYTLPKIHKDMIKPPGRPVVAGNGGPLHMEHFHGLARGKDPMAQSQVQSRIPRPLPIPASSFPGHQESSPEKQPGRVSRNLLLLSSDRLALLASHADEKQGTDSAEQLQTPAHRSIPLTMKGAVLFIIMSLAQMSYASPVPMLEDQEMGYALQETTPSQGDALQFRIVELPSEFNTYDMNKDGSITLNELSDITETQSDDANLPFHNADKDGNDMLTKQEFEEAPWVFHVPDKVMI